MGLVAINTVEIKPSNDSASVLRTRLEALLKELNRVSDCAAYHLVYGGPSSDTWVITGYWHSVEQMTAHFELPCLKMLFELTAERLVTGLSFRTFLAPTL